MLVTKPSRVRMYARGSMSSSVVSSSLQSPSPSPSPEGKALDSVALFEILGIEVLRRVRGDVESDGAESFAGIVDGVDGHRPGAVGAIDDPDEPLTGHAIRQDQGEGVLLHLRERRLARKRKERDAEEHAKRGAPFVDR